MSGTTSGAQARMLLETDPDYPADPANDKGHCPWTDPANKSTECAPPTKIFDVPGAPSPTILGFGGFLMGRPFVTADPARLLGVDWQFECAAADGAPSCSVDVTLDDVVFVSSLPGE